MTFKIKVLVCSLFLFFSLSVTVYSASVTITEVLIEPVTGSVALCGTLESDAFMKETGLLVYDDTGALCGVYQDVADDDGNFSFEFFVERGKYSLIVSHYDGGTSETTVYYADSEEIFDVLDIFRTANGNNLTSLFETYSVNGDKHLLDIEIDDFYRDNCNAVNSIVLQYIHYAETLDDIEKLYLKALGLIAINKSEEDDFAGNIEKYADVFELVIGDEYYEKQKDSICELMISYRKAGFNGFDDFQKAFEEAKVVSAVNSGEKDTLDIIMNHFSDVFEKSKEGFSKTIIEAYTEFAAVELNKSLVDKNFVSTKEIIEKFEKRYNELKSMKFKEESNVSSGGNLRGNSGGISVANTKIHIDVSETTDEINADANIKFDDIDTVEWASEAINYLADKHIINGTGGAFFEPQRSVTREEFSKMLVLLFGEDLIHMSVFNDVTEDDWCYPYIGSAYKMGIISGKPNGSFGKGEKISRQDASVMIYRAALLYNIEFDKIDLSMIFDDDDIISDYAKKAIYDIVRMGIVKGNGNNLFCPQGETTRAEAAVMLFRLDKLLK